MLKGDWCLNINYKKGDIVTIYDSFMNRVDYYICAMAHVADELVNPRNPEEIYWIEIKDMCPIEWIYSTLPSTTSVAMSGLELPPPAQTSDMNNLDSKKSLREDKLKRKLKHIENDINAFKKKRKLQDGHLDLKQQIMLLNVDKETKVFLLDKYETMQKLGNSDYAKCKAWLKTVINLPFGRHKPLKVRVYDSEEKINNYFKQVRKHLDRKVHKMDKVKDEIMEFLARKISNPCSKGHILALCGAPGVGKTKILKSLAEALELPFYQINFGGLNDVNVLTGHSETYVGSKPGKLVEILTNAGCMNPIIYLDEIDKISEHKMREINGILTHLLDEEQNDKFQDNYLSNININLSKALFVIAFNDIDKVDRIVSDRMKVIHIDSPNIEEKLTIASDKIIPNIIDTLNIKKNKYINLDNDLLKYIIDSKTPKEDGVRQLKKCLEKIFSKINYLCLTGQYNTSNLNIIKSKNKTEYNHQESNEHVYTETIHITRKFIDDCLESHNNHDTHYSFMYT